MSRWCLGKTGASTTRSAAHCHLCTAANTRSKQAGRTEQQRTCLQQNWLRCCLTPISMQIGVPGAGEDAAELQKPHLLQSPAPLDHVRGQQEGTRTGSKLHAIDVAAQQVHLHQLLCLPAQVTGTSWMLHQQLHLAHLLPLPHLELTVDAAQCASNKHSFALIQ